MMSINFYCLIHATLTFGVNICACKVWVAGLRQLKRSSQHPVENLASLKILCLGCHPLPEEVHFETTSLFATALSPLIWEPRGQLPTKRLLDLTGILTEYSVNRLNYDLVSPGASSDELGLSCEHPDHFQLWKSPSEGNILSGFPKTWKSKGGGGQAAPCLGTLAAAVHPEKSNSEDLQGLLLPHSHRTCLMMATGMNLIWRIAVVTVKISFNFRVFYVFSKN